MPTYDYECDGCQHTFELFQRMSDPPEKKCPKCGRKKARRLLGSGGGLLFKGSGFYITDYRSDAYKSSAKADSAAPPAPTASGKAAAAESGPKPSTGGAKA